MSELIAFLICVTVVIVVEIVTSVWSQNENMKREHEEDKEIRATHQLNRTNNSTNPRAD